MSTYEIDVGIVDTRQPMIHAIVFRKFQVSSVAAAPNNERNDDKLIVDLCDKAKDVALAILRHVHRFTCPFRPIVRSFGSFIVFVFDWCVCPVPVNELFLVRMKFIPI